MSEKNFYFAVLEEIFNNVVPHWSTVLVFRNHSVIRLISFTKYASNQRCTPLRFSLLKNFSMLPGWGGILVRLPAAVAAGQRHRLHGPPGELQRRSRHNSFLLNNSSLYQKTFLSLSLIHKNSWLSCVGSLLFSAESTKCFLKSQN
jgi:hypothetical protein